ncbi:LPXTG-motif protein cell wall anchor domain protein [Aerococcus christensenii]|uniref:LPXTG-motif protein cell wall anchor domain protein n=3 Tax=Aerococcus christensenii TaxID=87541 RepID=A0A133XQC2_9LACT|nr:LPXTG-motif protein cell wall anchor domain protein [Aerococcus christensenii]
MLKQARHPKSFGTYLPETGVVGNSIWSLLTILGLVGTFMLHGEKKK